MELFNRKALIENIVLKKEDKELKEQNKNYESSSTSLCNAIENNFREMYNEKFNRNHIHLESIYLDKEITYKAEIRKRNEIIRENEDAYIKLADKYDELKKKYCRLHIKEVISVCPDRDGKGPRKRSYKPSVKKGGDQRGNCK